MAETTLTDYERQQIGLWLSDEIDAAPGEGWVENDHPAPTAVRESMERLIGKPYTEFDSHDMIVLFEETMQQHLFVPGVNPSAFRADPDAEKVANFSSMHPDRQYLLRVWAKRLSVMTASKVRLEEFFNRYGAQYPTPDNAPMFIRLKAQELSDAYDSSATAVKEAAQAFVKGELQPHSRMIIMALAKPTNGASGYRDGDISEVETEVPIIAPV